MQCKNEESGTRVGIIAHVNMRDLEVSLSLSLSRFLDRPRCSKSEAHREHVILAVCIASIVG
jgi:hypothetical protein